MSLVLDLEQNLPEPLIYAVSAAMSVPIHRVGNFYDTRTGPGCGTVCYWNGGGYFGESFTCGETFPSGL